MRPTGIIIMFIKANELITPLKEKRLLYAKIIHKTLRILKGREC